MRTPPTIPTDPARRTTPSECSGTCSFPSPPSLFASNPLYPSSDHDELRHSLRSVLANFRQYTNNFRILTSDIEYPHDVSASFPDPNTDSGTGYWRLGLLPQWLETSQSGTTEWRDGDVRLSITHHAHFFEPYNRSIFNRCVARARECV